MKEKHESPKEKEMIKVDNEQKQDDKIQKESDKTRHKEDKVKDKLKAGAEKKHDKQDLNKKIQQKKTVVDFNSDNLVDTEKSQQVNILSKCKKTTNMKPELSDSSNESDMKITNYDSDDFESETKESSDKKKLSGLKRSDELKKKSQNKRKRIRSESDDEFCIESIKEKQEFSKPEKSSLKRKRIKNQVSCM